MKIEQIEQIARVCHEVNREYCMSINDFSQLTWEKAPNWQKESAIQGVKFHLENPEAGPDASHISWVAQKIADGWKYGKEKNAEKKEHPCIVPFDELPKEQQAKDFIFRAIVHTMKNICF